MNLKVEAYFKKAKQWQPELNALRKILLSCDLEEDIKWHQASYSFDKHIIVVIMALKKSCGLLFFKGALLKDPEHILIRPTANTNAGRQIRFTNVQQIIAMQKTLKAYVKQAIAVQKAGLKVKPVDNSKLDIPEEFQRRMHEMPELKAAFKALTPGRQRDYIFYFSGAKQSKTRESRIDKCVDLILDGEGLHDTYLKEGKSKKK